MSIPKGLFILRNAFDEAPIRSYLQTLAFTPITVASGSRGVVQFGHTYVYRSREANTSAEKIPSILHSLIKDAIAEPQYNCIIVNRYEGDQGISAHRDSAIFGDQIICFVVGNGAEIEFRRGDETYSVYMTGGDIYIMSGESRQMWTHQIRKRKSDVVDGVRIPRGLRYSITYRQLL